MILDAYVRNSQVPPHLTTLEFYQAVKHHLEDDGVFATNVHGGTALFQSHVKTMSAAFPQVVFFPGRQYRQHHRDGGEIPQPRSAGGDRARRISRSFRRSLTSASTLPA